MGPMCRFVAMNYNTMSNTPLKRLPRALTDPRGHFVPPISQCTIINYDMNYLVLIHYEAEICKRSSKTGGGESCIVEHLCIVL